MLRLLVCFAIFVPASAGAQELHWIERDARVHPPERHDFAMGYHRASAEVVLFGQSQGTNPAGDGVWIWRAAESIWEQDATSILWRGNFGSAYHPTIDKLVFSGGTVCGFDCEDFSETILFDGASWEVLEHGAAGPPGRSDPSLAYHALLDRVILFGGGLHAMAPTANDTWAFDGQSWEQIQTSTAPSIRTMHAMAYDEERDEIVMFGGGDAETWIFDGTDWAQREVSGPSPRHGHTMVWAPPLQSVLLFGGGLLNVMSDELWSWDGQRWQQLASESGPSARLGHGMVYDDARTVMVLFGGQSATTELDDTWELAFDAVAFRDLIRVGDGALSGQVDTDLPQPLVVQAIDSTGAPLAEVAIAWAASGGAFTTTTTKTDALGRASAAVRLGEEAGTATFRARAGARSVEFQAEVLPDPPAALILETSGEAVVGEAIGATIEVHDRFQNLASIPRTIAFSSNDDPAAEPSSNATVVGSLTVQSAVIFRTEGAHTLTITALEDGLTATADVEVKPPNRAPELTIASARFEVHCGERLVFQVIESDPDRDPTQVTIRDLPPGAAYNEGSGDFVWKPACIDARVYRPTFVVTDGELESERAVTIVVISSYYGCASSPPDLTTLWLLAIAAVAALFAARRAR